MSIEPVAYSSSLPKRTNLTIVTAVVGMIGTILTTGIGVLIAYTVAQTHSTDRGDDVDRRLNEMQAMISDQGRAIRSLEDRVTRIEVGDDHVKDTLAELKIQIVPKH